MYKMNLDKAEMLTRSNLWWLGAEKLSVVLGEGAGGRYLLLRVHAACVKPHCQTNAEVIFLFRYFS